MNMSSIVHLPQVAQRRPSTNGHSLCSTAKLAGYSLVAIGASFPIAQSIHSEAFQKPILLVYVETDWRIDILLCATTRTGQSLPLDPSHLMNQVINLCQRKMAESSCGAISQVVLYPVAVYTRVCQIDARLTVPLHILPDA